MSLAKSLIKKGILISPEILKDQALLERLSELPPQTLGKNIVIDKTFLQEKGLLPGQETEKQEQKTVDEGVQEEKTREGKIGGEKEEIKEIKGLQKPGPGLQETGIKILFSYDKKPGKINIDDFVAHFNKRFSALSNMLRQRQGLKDNISINRLKNKVGREKVQIIGMVLDKRTTKNKNIILALEDPTGQINVLINNNKKDAYSLARDTVLDETIGVEGVVAGDIIFADKLTIPDIPNTQYLKKGPEKEYLALLGDPHLGSNTFLENEFKDFIQWINSKKGNLQQKEIAEKIKYLIIIGDLVEGVGIYPGQEKDLLIKDIKEQYDAIAEYLKQIPPNINILICPGNHDIGRISEPQPPINHKYAASLKQLPNITMLSNPSLINIGAKPEQGFEGFDILLYHGYSLIYYADNVERIRSAGGQKRPDLLMKFLLQRRHLAPTHTSNLYVPDPEADPLIITHPPDFFITGHIHRVSVDNYKKTTMINCSCWSDITEDMEKRGLQPQPGKVPVINLKTREVKIINFFKQKNKT